LEQAQGAFMSGIDQTTCRFPLLQYKFAQLVAPESDDGQRRIKVTRDPALVSIGRQLAI
jgi:hypothetical protein